LTIACIGSTRTLFRSTPCFAVISDSVVRWRADLAERDRFAGDILVGFESGLIGFVRRDEGVEREAGGIARVGGDDADLALAAELIERCRKPGRAEIDVARDRRDRDRQRGREEHHLRVEAFLGEIALIDRDEDRTAGSDLGRADLDGFGLGARREPSERGEDRHSSDKLHPHSLFLPALSQNCADNLAKRKKAVEALNSSSEGSAEMDFGEEPCRRADIGRAHDRQRDPGDHREIDHKSHTRGY
jgi:hypothetical protein